MATDKFRALALECEDLPDDSLLRILSGEFTLDDLTVGMTTRQIMAMIDTAPSMLGPAVYLANNAKLIAFRVGPLNVRADLLEAAVPSACAATNRPVPGGAGNLVLGYGYATPGDIWGEDFTSNPANRADEVGYDMTGVGSGPESWTSITPGGPLPPVPAFPQSAVGTAFIGIWMRNCYNRALGNNGDFAQSSGSILDLTSPLAPVVYAQVFADLTANPTTVDLCAKCIASPGTAVELAIRRDSEGGAVLYTGGVAGPAPFDVNCADVDAGQPIPLFFVFSGAGGSDEIVLPSYLFPQDNGGVCNP